MKPLMLDATYCVLSSDELVKVREDLTTGHKSLVATCPCKADDILCAFSAGETFSEANRLTIQIGINQHITLKPKFLQYTNHSCAPNIFFDTTPMNVMALKAIKPGDELKFFYPSTEWDMAQPFACHCEESDCLRYINGAAYMAPSILRQHRLTDFIQRQIAGHQAKAR
jgi:hypothetical protein